jgi:CheY-like chemotaxis protein/anti-sigma regulatory factor (Ser/Thr protein kinase)
MLEAMLRNLLSNAVRYTDRGAILLGCRRVGEKVRLEVWDSGIGISQSQLPYIFDEYYQGEQGAERGGFGLGLAIVRRMGKVLDHRIEVRSTPGKGAVFSIEVPRGQASRDTTKSAQTLQYEREDFPDSILIVEDETSVRTSLTRLLKTRGIEAVVVATANDALARISRQEIRPGLLICDYNLRGSANGVDTIKALQAALGSKIPAIIMTGDIRSEVVDAIAAEGIAVLIKPFPADELLLQIARSHRGYRAGNPGGPAIQNKNAAE